MKRTIIGAILILGTLNAAHADTLVFRDTLRPHDHDRSKAARLGDGRQCGGYRNGDFPTAMTESYTQCMQARGWALDHVIPDRPSAYAHAPSFGSSPAPVDDGPQRTYDLQRREAPPDDRLRAIRESLRAARTPDFAALHPGYDAS